MPKSAAVVADGADREARAQCLIAAWLAGTVLSAGTGLQHKLAHVLGGLGLPHAEKHAIILPHVMRFNLEAAPDAETRLQEALGSDHPADAIAGMLKRFPIAQRLHEVGFDAGKTDFVANEMRLLRSHRHEKSLPAMYATYWRRRIDFSPAPCGEGKEIHCKILSAMPLLTSCAPARGLAADKGVEFLRRAGFGGQARLFSRAAMAGSA